MRLPALQYDASAVPTDADCLSFLNFLLSLVDGRVSNEKEDSVTLPLSIALKSWVHRFCRANFNGIETNYVVSDWLTRGAVLLMKNSEFE